jgi:hypothetical protein
MINDRHERLYRTHDSHGRVHYVEFSATRWGRIVVTVCAVAVFGLLAVRACDTLPTRAEAVEVDR